MVCVPVDVELIGSLLDIDTQEDTTDLKLVGQRRTFSQSEVDTLGAGISKIQYWVKGKRDATVQASIWSDATEGTDIETVVATTDILTADSNVNQFVLVTQTFLDSTGTFAKPFKPTAGVEYVIGIEMTAVTNRTETGSVTSDVITGNLTERENDLGDDWTDTVGGDWSFGVIYTIPCNGQADSGVGALLLADPTAFFDVDAILDDLATPHINALDIDAILDDITGPELTHSFLVDALLIALGANGNCPVPAIENIYSRPSAASLADRIGGGLEDPQELLTRTGVELTDSTFDGVAIKDIQCRGMNRNGVGATGLMYARVRNKSDIIVAESAARDVTTFPTGATANHLEDFVFPNPVVLREGYKILLEFPVCVGCDNVLPVTGGPNIWWFGTAAAPPTGMRRSVYTDNKYSFPTGFSNGGDFSLTTSDAVLGNQHGCVTVGAIIKRITSGCILNYSDDMTTPANWISTDTTAPFFVDIVGGVLDWESQAASINITAGNDFSTTGRLGTTLDDNGNWRIRWKANFTTIGVGPTGANRFVFYVSDDDQLTNVGGHPGNPTLENGIGIMFTVSGASGMSIQAFFKDQPNSLIQTVGTLETGLMTGGQVRYCEIIRDSSTSATWNVYSDASFSTLIGTQTKNNLAATIVDLRYAKAGNDNFFSTANALEGNFDDLEIIQTLTESGSGAGGCMSINGFVVLQTPEDFTVDAILKNVKEFSLDAKLSTQIDVTQVNMTIPDPPEAVVGTALVDAILIGTEKTYTVDGITFLVPSELITINAILQSTFTKDFTVDAVLKATLTEDYAVDAIIKAFSQTDTFTVDGILNIQVVLNPFVDSILSTGSDTSYCVDSCLTLTAQKIYTVDAQLVIIPKAFTVDALIKSLGVNGCGAVFFDPIGGNSGLWTVVGGSQIVVDSGGSGVLEWNGLTGGATVNERFAFRTIPNFADNTGVLRIRVKVSKINDSAPTNPTGRFIVLQNNALHPNPSTGSQFQIALGGGTANGAIFASIFDGTNSAITTPRPNFPNGTTKYLEAVYDPVGQTLTQNVFTDANFSVHDTGSPFQVDASAVSMTGLTFTHMLTSNIKNSGPARILSADLDDFTIGGACPSFSIDGIITDEIFESFIVDAILVVPLVTNTQNFIIDGIAFIPPAELYNVDAILQAFGLTEIFEIDALLDVVQLEIKDFTVDSLLDDPNAVIEDFTIDAILKTLGDNGSCVLIYTDNFSSDRFVDMDSSFISVSTGSSRMEFDAQTDNTNDASASDISLVGRFGSILPPTWRIRFNINFQTYLVGNNNHMMFSIGDRSQTINSRTGSSEQSIGFHAVTSTDTSSQSVRGYHKDGSTQINTSNLLTGNVDTMTGTKFYQIERTSDTSVTYSIFSDSGFTTLISSVVQTIPNLTGLQYFKVSNWQFFNTGEGTMIGILDSLEIAGLNPSGNVACSQIDAKLVIKQTKTFEVDALIQVLGENGNCPIPETETIYTRSKSPSLADRFGGAGIIRGGMQVTGPTLVGKAIEDVRVRGLARNNVGATGTIFVTVRNSSDNLISQSTNSILAEDLPDNSIGDDITFTLDKKVVLREGYRILVEFPTCIGCDETPPISGGPNVFWFGTSAAPPTGLIRIIFTKDSVYAFPTGFTPGGVFSFTTSAAEPARQRGCASMDARLIKDGQTKDFNVDAFGFLPPAKLFLINALLDAQDKTVEFTVDAKTIIPESRLFDIDAILTPSFVTKDFIVDVSITPDTGVVRDIGDLIIRVLFENEDLGGSGLTGSQVVDNIVAITTAEPQWGFIGKNSRIRSWLNTMKFRGIVEEDGSDPDWYETIWTLV